MKKTLLLILPLLAAFAYVCYQESCLLFYGYQADQLRMERIQLENEERRLWIEIREMLPSERLYSYWKANCPHLDFPAANQERSMERTVAQVER